MKHFIITAKQDERVFKEGDKIDLTLLENGVNYIVGPNGCGKSTILHAIRAHKDTIYENKSHYQKLDIARNFDLKLYDTVFDIEGLDDYKNVFCLDASLDNPVSFENASTATAIVDGGGLIYNSRSRGEGSKYMMVNFIYTMQKITGATINKQLKTIENTPQEKSLIVIDEMDEGLDLVSQVNYGKLLRNLCKIFNATVICVCHNPICILADELGDIYPIYDMSDRKYKEIKTYVAEQTDGMEIIIKHQTNGK